MFKLAGILLSSMLMSVLPFAVNAQSNTLTVKSLIDQALDSNYTLQSGTYLIKRSQIQNTGGYAGNLPSITLGGQGQYELNSSRLEFFDGASRGASNASNYSAGGSLDVNYPIYEAGAKAIRKERLNTQLDDAQINYQIDKQDLISEILQLVSSYEFHEEQVETYKEDTLYWSNLLQLRKDILSYGKGSQIDIIQIQTELNASIAQLERTSQQKFIVETRLRDLTFLSDSEGVQDMEVNDFLDQLLVRTGTPTSPLLDRQKVQIRQAELSMELSKTLQYPLLSLFAGYGYNWSRNAVGILLSNTNFGPYGGLRLNWNLYDGDRVDIDIQSAKLQMSANKALYEDTQRELNYREKELKGALNRQQIILQQESRQKQLLEDQFELVQAQYREGRIDVLEVLNFQRRVLLNQLNMAEANFQIRNYKVQLLYNDGTLAQLN